jgi:hypothetical protein
LNPAGALALKLVLTPVLVGAASLAGRRWGSAVSGWLIGIPFTSAPIALFLTLDAGPTFGARAAVGIMAGAVSQAVFCLAYSWAAQRWTWTPALLAASLGFGASTVALELTGVLTPSFLVVVIVALVVALFLMPAQGGAPPDPADFPRWDLPARMVVATAFVVALTAAAPVLGARLAGLLAPFPLYGAVLASFAHRLQGAGAAVGVMRGLLLGLFAFSAFFVVLATLLERDVALAFVSAIVVALAVQGISLAVGRRLGLA